MNNRIPFGLLTPEEQQTLKDYKGELETYNPSKLSWSPKIPYLWDRSEVYRIKSVKPSINWNHVVPLFNYMAESRWGHTYLFQYEPKLDEKEGKWLQSGLHCFAVNFTSFKPGTCDWTESLVERP